MNEAQPQVDFVPAPLMDSPRRNLALFFGVFVIFVVAGLAIGGLWLANGQPEPPTADPDPESRFGCAGGNQSNSSAGGVPTTWVVNRYSVQVVTSTLVITHGVPVAVGDWAQVEAVKVDNGLQATTIALRRARHERAVRQNRQHRRTPPASGRWAIRVSNWRPTRISKASPSVGSLAKVYGQQIGRGDHCR